MKVAVIQFPGNNCETETARACRLCGMNAEIFRWNRPYNELTKFDAYILGGGFGYEDRIRAGVIASKDPIMRAIKKQAEKGKMVLGICNGAQALVETGLIPGVKNEPLAMCLARNKRVKNGKVLGTGLYNTWVTIKSTAPQGRSAFNFNIPEKTLISIPVAHGEGRFVTADPELLHQLIANHQILFRYCNAAGAIIDEFPTNPNGTLYNIAGICNPAGNIMAIMPHPERGVEPPGKLIFRAMLAYYKNGAQYKAPKALKYQAPPAELKSYQLSKNAAIIKVDLIITDNEAFTANHTLREMGFPDVSLKRRTFFEIKLDEKLKNPEQVLSTIIKSGTLINTNKEIPYIYFQNQSYAYSTAGLQKIKKSAPAKYSVLVKNQEDLNGTSKTAILRNRLGLTAVQNVTHATLWEITPRNKPQETFTKVIYSYLLHNPHSQSLYLL